MRNLWSDGEEKGVWRYCVMWLTSCLGVKTSGYLIHRFCRIV